MDVDVAPVRERGLKLAENGEVITMDKGRSREGAWIEIRAARVNAGLTLRRSREGAWIEILANRLSAFLASGSLP